MHAAAPMTYRHNGSVIDLNITKFADDRSDEVQVTRSLHHFGVPRVCIERAADAWLESG
jgi:hypothetical protein